MSQSLDHRSGEEGARDSFVRLFVSVQDGEKYKRKQSGHGMRA